MTFQQIRTRHVSKHGLEGPPEQETKTKEVNRRAIDKWAQEVTHRPKFKVGGPIGGSADQAGRPTCPWAPRPSGSTWRSPIGCLWRFDEARLQLTPWLPPINTKGGGVEKWNTHHTQHTTHLHPLFLGSLKIFILEHYKKSFNL